jgi:hypothetical protein
MVFFQMRWILSISSLSSFAVISHSSNAACYIFLSHSLTHLLATLPKRQASKTIQQGFFISMLAVFLLIFIILLDLFFALNEHDSKMNEAVTPLHIHMRMMLMRDGYIAVIIPRVECMKNRMEMDFQMSFAFIEIDLLCKVLVIQLATTRETFIDSLLLSLVGYSFSIASVSKFIACFVAVISKLCEITILFSII